ncbi:hypothetical protein D3874_05045 [Oleomonas cavernae]|uniref:Acetoacetate decarboxylase n=2 Tax=Oleomonas cavernae TaxID=2320859 RepID=A0A418W8X7_9PROT|nr:hypothetical protein D3874_05045 [Oleomonas cavernae]
MNGFLFEADRRALQRTCDRCLNDPSTGRLRFRVVAPYVLLTALYVDRMSSADPIDKSKGFVRETDIGFWIPVVGGLADAPGRWKVYWLPTYMFVDSGSALSGGREVFGYPKTMGVVHRGSGGPQPMDFTVDTEHFTKFAPDAEGRVQRLFAVSSNRATSEEPAIETTTTAEVAAAMWQIFDAFLPDDIFVLPLSGDAFLPYIGMPMIFLKQFRDHESANRACYQAVTAVTVSTDSVGSVRLPRTKTRLVVAGSASHPISADLGIPDGREATLAMQMSLDFTVGFGSTLCQFTSDGC